MSILDLDDIQLQLRNACYSAGQSLMRTARQQTDPQTMMRYSGAAACAELYADALEGTIRDRVLAGFDAYIAAEHEDLVLPANGVYGFELATRLRDFLAATALDHVDADMGSVTDSVAEGLPSPNFKARAAFAAEKLGGDDHGSHLNELLSERGQSAKDAAEQAPGPTRPEESHAAGADADEEARERYLEWLSAEIGLYCDADGRFPAEWDYDQLSPDTILGAWRDFEGEGYGNARDLLEDRVLAAEREGLLLELSGYLERDLPEAAPEVAAAYRASEDVMADLEEAGFAGFSANLDELLGKTTFRVDAFFATQAELNRDLRSIGFAFDESRFLDIRLNSRPVELALDNALSYLVNQQGHSVVEVCDAVRGEQPESDFIASVAEELAEHVIESGALCALLEMDGERMMEFLGEWDRPVDYLVLPKGTTIGVYSEMHGAGGPLNIRLERDAVLPMAMCHWFTVEGQSGVDGYTVDSCYGLSESCWRAGASYQKFPGKLLHEDYDRALDEARARAGRLGGPLPPARAEVDRLPRDRLPGGQATSRSR